MAVIGYEMSRRGLARGSVAFEVQADLQVVNVIDSPTGAVQGQLEPAAVLAPEQNARVERVSRCEEAQARNPGGRDDQTRDEALAVQEVRAEKELMLSGSARRRLKGAIAERRAGQRDTAGRLRLRGVESRADHTPGAE